MHSGPLSDIDIAALCDPHNQIPMLTPFVSEPVRDNGVISYGAENYTYDARLGPELKIFKTKVCDGTIDPKQFDSSVLMHHTATPEENVLTIPPHGFALGCTFEVFHMPHDVMAVCMSKSTYARVGLIVNVSPVHPGFVGQVVVELSNTTNYPVQIYAYEGICQFLFLRGQTFPTGGYNGRYNNQVGVVTPPALI